eukprot:2786706-Pyramimonas_sp.AAC.1
MTAIGNASKTLFKKGPAAPSKKAAAGANVSHHQWWNQVKGDRAWLEKHRPPIGGIYVDDTAGRFQLSYPGFQPRSVSWTRRGMDVANAEACRILWEWHSKATPHRRRR